LSTLSLLAVVAVGKAAAVQAVIERQQVFL
jgi:hypothetical protein